MAEAASHNPERCNSMTINALLKHVSSVLLVAFCFLFASPHLARADAPAVFKQLAGSWRGSGDLTLSDGSRERLSCRGYYVLKEKGSGLSLAIRCQSTNYQVRMRSSLTSRAGRLTGRWEERTFNAQGEVTGRATGNGMQLSISGAISGSLSVTLRGRTQRVNISTEGTGFRGVSISLVRG